MRALSTSTSRRIGLARDAHAPAGPASAALAGMTPTARPRNARRDDRLATAPRVPHSGEVANTNAMVIMITAVSGAPKRISWSS